ncbi:MAG: DNA adenine methylase [Candidatus Abyssobacteria bacterium SURF_5]|uniref:site-specific DNA-methyltransferase (adenine-specific) n=1 Tax=Abyssobacteria bacterium (strain SURF_5) TaxID=2093360 RepID=A0A3A4NU41_ABYX5|nr:MAG: DNA adenine methylase [Candidatus Abyssubacteria bacterium SURF_5]
MRYYTPLRYPGGKGKLADFIKLIIRGNGLLDRHYAEPYAGGAAVALSLLFDEYVSEIHINDIDETLHAFWHSVLYETRDLCTLISKTPVTLKEWHCQKNVQENPKGHSKLEIGFSTFFLNRTNRSGIITGGVIGGKKQEGKWKIGARYNKSQLIHRVQKIGKYKDRIHLYNLDAFMFITSVLEHLDQRMLVYLDPPYLKKGRRLYRNNYQYNDHVKISDLIRARLKQNWVISYDYSSEISALYHDYNQLIYQIPYSAGKRYRGSEVVIYSKTLTIPACIDPLEVNRKSRNSNELGKIQIQLPVPKVGGRCLDTKGRSRD